MQFIYFKGQASCPICGQNNRQTNGKCREVANPEAYDRLVYCGDNQGSPGDRVDEFICIGEPCSVNDLLQPWGAGKKDDNKSSNKSGSKPVKHTGRPVTKATTKTVVKTTKKPSTKKAVPDGLAMPVKDRDPIYRNILNQLNLDQADRDDLIDRGVSCDRLDLFRTVSKDTIVACQVVPPGLKGRAGGAKFLADLTESDGYLCPALDYQDRIQGFQVRVRSGQPKYIWLAGSRLPNGELPLAVYYPGSQRSDGAPTILFCEGIGPKPLLIAERWGVTTIGASGGNFSASPETLREQIMGVLDRQVREQDLSRQTLRFVLVPDAWGIGNPSVAGRDKKTCDLLARTANEILDLRREKYPQKITIKVASWGQECDCLGDDGDEIDLSNVRPVLRPIDRYFSQTPSNSQLAVAAIQKYLNENASSRSELNDRVAQNTIAKQHDLSPQQLIELWQQFEQSRSRVIPSAEVVEAYVTGIPPEVLQSLSTEAPPTEKISYYLAADATGFADELARFCKILGVPEIAAIVGLGPVVASVIRPSTRLIGMAASDLKGRPGNWAMIIGESGAAKSPLCNALTAPLFRIQKDHNTRFFQPIYESWLQKPPRQRGTQPRPYTAIATNTTAEAITACQSANGDQGLLIYADEIGKIFSLDQYKAGGGSSRQDLLEMRGGAAASVRRVGKDGSHDVSTNGVQILGGVQPLIYKQLFDSDDPDGFLARLNITFIPRWTGRWDSGGNTNISDRLHEILVRIRSYPTGRHSFTDMAQEEYRRWFEHCQTSKLSAKSRALASVWSKSIGEALNRCVELHYLSHALKDPSGKTSPPTMIGCSVLRLAIGLVRYQIAMATRMAALTVKDEQAERYAYVINVSRKASCDPARVEQDNPFCGWISAASVRRAFKDSKGEQIYFGGTSEIKALFVEMARNLFGETRSNGKDLLFRANPSQLDKLAIAAGHQSSEFVMHEYDDPQESKSVAFLISSTSSASSSTPETVPAQEDLLTKYNVVLNEQNPATRATQAMAIADILLSFTPANLSTFYQDVSNWDKYISCLANCSTRKASALESALELALKSHPALTVPSEIDVDSCIDSYLEPVDD